MQMIATLLFPHVFCQVSQLIDFYVVSKDIFIKRRICEVTSNMLDIYGARFLYWTPWSVLSRISYDYT